MRALLGFGLLIVACGSTQVAPPIGVDAGDGLDAAIADSATAADTSATPDTGAVPDSGTGAEPTAAALLAKVASCGGKAVKGGFGLDAAGNISIFKCPGALYWKADFDVDCDGIQTPPCNIDPQGQPQTSIKDIAPTGDVDPTKLPYFVIPLGKPETTWYRAHGVELGQVGAVIYKGQVRYGIFADEAGGFFIGEASYAMCQLFLGKPVGGKDPCSPINGGIDPADITYVTFTGAANQAKGADIYSHATHTRMGISAANTWLATP
jgi:hypothetical protein